MEPEFGSVDFVSKFGVKVKARCALRFPLAAGQRVYPGVDQKLPGIDDVVTKLRRPYRGNSLRYDLFVFQIAVVRDHDDHVGRIVAADLWSTISNLYVFVG